jgi:hypothetical protein
MSDAAGPAVGVRVMAAPKAGHSDDEYEDAAAVRGEAWPVRAAVADGATESAFARSWARGLARGAVDAGVASPAALEAALPDWQAQWKGAVAGRLDDLPWYAEAKAGEGAFATLLGLAVRANGAYEAVAVGDCALLHVRGEALVRAWPLASADAFGTRPALLPSRPDRAVPAPEHLKAPWTAGDALLLASDAVAAWLLRTGAPRARHFEADGFRERVAAARADGTLRNDDCTLVVLTIDPS